MSQVVLLILCSFLAGVCTTSVVFYVISENSNPVESCPGSSCATLNNYANNVSQYSTNNAKFIFLSGTHFLNAGIPIKNVQNVTFTGISGVPATLHCRGSGGFTFQNVSNVTLAHLLVVSCGQPIPPKMHRVNEIAHAALAFAEVSNLIINAISVEQSRGFGLSAHCIYGDFKVIESSFRFNTGNRDYLGGNAIIENTNCSACKLSHFSITSSTFSHGNYWGYAYDYYSGTLATGLTVLLSQTSINLNITNVVMENNTNCKKKGLGGNMFIHIYNTTNYISNKILIMNSKFIGGLAWVGGGLGVSFYTSSKTRTSKRQGSKKCVSVLKLKNTTISDNEGIIGSGLYIIFQMMTPHHYCPKSHVEVLECTFQNNKFVVPPSDKHMFIGQGVATHILTKYHNHLLAQDISNHLKVRFENTTFIFNRIVIRERALDNLSKLKIDAMTFSAVSIKDSITIKNCNFTSNEITGIGVFKSMVRFQGEIIIRNNTGINGGGITLCQSSFIILTGNTSIDLIGNHAIESGGGIFAEDQCFSSKTFCFYQIDCQGWKCTNAAEEGIFVRMVDNTAEYAGNHIYGGALDNCIINKCQSTEVFHSLYRFDSHQYHSDLSLISSNPRHICFCKNEKPDCGKQNYNYFKSVYPGENISIHTVVVGQFNGTVPGTIKASSDFSKNEFQEIRTNKSCTPLIIPVKTGNSSCKKIKIKLQLLSDINQAIHNVTYLTASNPGYVNISIKQCPLGFNHSEGVCKCAQILLDNDINSCFIANQSILRMPPIWLSFDTNSKRIIYHEVCPYDYCRPTPVFITSNSSHFNEAVQCASNRTGILCGKCANGYSVSMFSSACMQCKNKAFALPAIVLGHLILGVVLVIILITFNITYTDGKFTGVIFYSSIVSINDFIFYLPQDKHNILHNLMSSLSLSMQINLCFYDGMDSYTKIWLRIGFPVYLCIIIGIITFLSNKYVKIAKLCGANIIKVFVTLFQISYTKLIHTIVYILSFTVIEYPSEDPAVFHQKYVWLYDPNIEYFHGKHIPLALVGIGFGVLILAYTLTLLFIQPLQRYSHLCCFSWIARLKPLVDAYTAPHIIKDNCRYWEGLLLSFRFILAIIFATNIKSKVDTNITAISSFCVILLTISWCMGGIYKKAHLNILNSSSILNLALLSIAISHTNKYKYKYRNTRPAEHGTYQSIIVISFSVVLFTIYGVLVHHIYVCIKSWCLKCKRFNYQALSPELPDNGLPQLDQLTCPR